MRATAAPLASPASTSLASSRGSLGSRARAVHPRASARVSASLPRRAFLPRASLRLGTVSRDRSVARAADTPGGAPPLEIDDDADADAPVATPGVPTKRPDDDAPVPNPPLRVAAALAAAGCLESSYLAFEKIVGGDVACPLSGCQTALTSGYSELFGVPLSAYGAASYGLVAALAWWGAGMRDDLDSESESESDAASAFARARLLVFLAGAGLAGVSTYLLYVLAVPLGGAECVYCLTSAAISFTVAAIGFSGLSARETGRVAPAAVALYAVTVLGLSLVLVPGDDDAANAKDLVLPYKPPTIEATSTAYSRSLAEYLKLKGAKMYGAFWCSHCEDQKETFGAGAEIPYVECFPDGWKRGTPVAAACAGADISGFPTWILADGTRFEGEKSLEELAKAVGFEPPPPAADAAAQLDAFLGQ